jgi:hypothetical protein
VSELQEKIDFGAILSGQKGPAPWMKKKEEIRQS